MYRTGCPAVTFQSLEGSLCYCLHVNVPRGVLAVTSLFGILHLKSFCYCIYIYLLLYLLKRDILTLLFME